MADQLYIPFERSRAIDEYAIRQRGISGIELMGTAGRMVFETIRSHGYLNDANGPVVVVCGKGNNGGDGFVVAQHLATAKIPVQIILVPDPADIQGAAAHYFKMMQALKIPLLSADGPEIGPAILKASLLIDGLLGTGITGTTLREPYARLVKQLNAASAPIVAIDVPSGLSGDFGKVTDPVITANLTVTMGFPKTAMLFSPAKIYLGELVVADIGFPRDSLSQTKGTLLKLLQPNEMDLLYPHRALNAYKYQVGKVSIIAGSKGFSGAAILASQAAIRSGAGLVRLAVPECIGAIAETLALETIVSYCPETTGGGFSPAADSKLAELIDWADVVALGPGAGREPETCALLRKLIVTIKKPLVIDADGLFALAEDPDSLKRRAAPTILTPHLGEFKSLLKQTPINPTPDWAGAVKFAENYGVYLLLKGAPSLVATPGGEVFVNCSGNAGLATAGTGDVLTGMIASLLAQKPKLPEILNYAMYKHGQAGDAARREKGELGLIAGDVVNALPEVLRP